MGDPNLDDAGYVRPGVTFTEADLGATVTVLSEPRPGEKWLAQRMRFTHRGATHEHDDFAAHTLHNWYLERRLTNCLSCTHYLGRNRLPCWWNAFPDRDEAGNVRAWRAEVGLPVDTRKVPTPDQVGCPEYKAGWRKTRPEVTDG